MRKPKKKDAVLQGRCKVKRQLKDSLRGVEKGTCDYCLKEFKKSQLVEHFKKCTDLSSPQVFICEFRGCQKSFSSKKSRKCHYDTHKELVRCPQQSCTTVLEPSEIPDHIRSAHENGMGNCIVCGEEKLLMKLRNHEKTCYVEDQKIFPCQIENCDRDFLTESSRRNHQCQHQGKTTCPFEDCDSLLTCLYMAMHIKSVHHRAQRPCPNCNKKIHFGSYNYHLNRCTSKIKNSFICNFKNCGMIFPSFEDRVQHNYDKHNPPIPCPNCDKMFSKRTLRIHIRHIHNKVKRQCQDCGKEMYNLYRHMKKACSKKNKIFYEVNEDNSQNQTGPLGHVVYVKEENMLDYNEMDIKRKIYTNPSTEHVLIKEECNIDENPLE